MTKYNRFCALAMSIVVIAILFFSNLYIITNAEHDCIGECCDICQTIEVCESSMKTTALFTAIMLLCSLATNFVCYVCNYKEVLVSISTLISLKVKLSD